MIRPRDLAAHGITRATFARLVTEGKLARRGRDLYAALNAPLMEHVTLVQASARVPHGAHLTRAIAASGKAVGAVGILLGAASTAITSLTGETLQDQCAI